MARTTSRIAPTSASAVRPNRVNAGVDIGKTLRETVLLEGCPGVVSDLLVQFRRSENARSATESQHQASEPPPVTDVHGDHGTAVGELLHRLAGVVLRNPPGVGFELDGGDLVVGRRLEQSGTEVPGHCAGGHLCGLRQLLHRRYAVQPEQADVVGAVTPCLEIQTSLDQNQPHGVDVALGLLVQGWYTLGQMESLRADPDSQAR